MKKSIVGILVLAVLTSGTLFNVASLVDIVKASTNATTTQTQVTTSQSSDQQQNQQSQQESNDQQQEERIIPNHPPIAKAGSDKQVYEGSRVALDASQSLDPDNDKILYEWRQIGGPRVTLDNMDSSTTTFAAPDVNRGTNLAFAVLVNDNKGGQDRDTVRVSVANADANSTPSSSSISNGDNNNNQQTQNVTTNALSNAQGVSNNNNSTSISRLQRTINEVAAENDQLAATGSFTAQALSQTIAYPSNNLVNTRSWYEISFKVGTTGTIARVEITFPAGTNIANAALTERSGVNAGSTFKSGQTISYVLATPQQINAGLVIRLEYSNILNPPIASANLAVQVTTKDSGGNTIESGTSVPYAIKQIGSSDLADNSVTTSQFGSKLADNAVTTPKIALDAVTTTRIKDLQVTESKIANGAVTANKLATDSVAADEIVGVSKLIFARCDVSVGTVPAHGFKEVSCSVPGASGVANDNVIVTDNSVVDDPQVPRNIHLLGGKVSGEGIVSLQLQNELNVPVSPGPGTTYSIMVFKP